MYECCSCQEKIGWARALVASPWFPYTCKACGTEQHRPINSFPIAILALVVNVLLLAGMFWLAVAFGSPFAFGGILVVVGLLVYAETRLYEGGSIVPTSPQLKVRTRIAWLAILSLPLALLALQEMYGKV